MPPNNVYGDMIAVKERFGPTIISSDSYDNDFVEKLNDSSDFILMKLEEHPLVFPNPSSLIGTDKTRLDRITNDLAAALFGEERSMRARLQSGAQSFEMQAVVWRKRAMMELNQFILVKTKTSDLGEIPDFVKVQGTKIGDR